MNKSDSEKISTILENQGYQPASKMNEADLIVVNMCSVRQSAVDRVYGLFPKFKKLKEKNPKLKAILTGCILKKDKRKFAKGFDQILKFKDLFSYQPKYQNNSVAFIPISNGCNNFCSYCVVPFARGPLVCRDHQEILKEVKNVVQKGFKEIWLLGQNVNNYVSRPNIKRMRTNEKQIFVNNSLSFGGNSSGIVNFAKLLKMVNEIPGDFKFFFTSPHPKNFSDELINTLAKCGKFGKLLNLPVQSGDDEILKKMNRPYNVEQYKNLVKKIREKIPDINLSTDIIVGFPGETKKQFENTLKLFKEIKFNIAYIAKYSPRAGTTAARLKDNVPLEEKKRRYKVLNDLLKNLKRPSGNKMALSV